MLGKEFPDLTRGDTEVGPLDISVVCKIAKCLIVWKAPEIMSGVGRSHRFDIGVY